MKKTIMILVLVVVVVVVVIKMAVATPILVNETVREEFDGRGLCRDDKNYLHIGWRSGVSDLHYSRSLDNGSTWESIFMNDFSTEPPDVACDGNNIYYVTKNIGDSADINRSLDNGATWSHVKTLDNVYDPHIKAEGGMVYYVSENMTVGDITIMFMNSSDNGSTWSDVVNAISGSSGVDMKHPEMEINNGNIYVVAENLSNSEIYFANSSDGGGTWSNPIVIMNISGASHPFIAFSGNHLWVVMFTNYNGVYIVNSSDGGGTWSDELRLDNSSHNISTQPIITINNSYPIVFWENNDTDGNQDVVYRVFNGSGWEAQVNVTGRDRPNVGVTIPRVTKVAGLVEFAYMANGTQGSLMYDYIGSNGGGGSCNPPSTGNTAWNVTSDANCSDRTIVIDNGWVRVYEGVALRLDNVTLLIDRLNDTDITATDSQFWINGSLVANNSVIGDYRQYPYLDFEVESGGVVELINSSLTSDISLIVFGNFSAVDTEILGRMNEFYSGFANLTRVETDQAYGRWWWYGRTFIKDSVLGGYTQYLYGNLTSINTTFYPSVGNTDIFDGGILNCTKPYSSFRMIEGDEDNFTVIGYLDLILEDYPSEIGERWIPVIVKSPNGSVVPSRNVSTYNSSGGLLWNGTTDVNGFVWAVCPYNLDNSCRVEEEGGNYFVTTRTSDTLDDVVLYVWEYDSFVNASATPNITGYGETVVLRDNITGLVPDAVWVNVTYPDGSINSFSATNLSTVYRYDFNDSWQMGEYEFQFVGNGTNSSYLGVVGFFSITGQTQMGVRVLEVNYSVGSYVNLTDPPIPSLPFSLNWGYVEESLVSGGGEVERNITTVIVELVSEPMIVYNGMVDEEVNSSFTYKVLGWLLGEGLRKSLRSRYLSGHKLDIDDEQFDVIREMGERYGASLYKGRKMNYLFNGFGLDVDEDMVDVLIAALERNPLVKSAMRSVDRELFLDGAIPAMDVDHVWALQNASGVNITGFGVKVAVLDTGIEYTHDAFGGCDLESIHNGSCEKIVFGYDFGSGDDDPMDYYGHGTHTAGIVGSGDDNYRGVAPNVSLMIYKVSDDAGRFVDADIIAAIENASLEGADVISMSFGAYVFINQETLTSALNNAWDNGTILVASAGNGGRYGYDTIGCPACLENVIAVGATNDAGVITSFSSRGFAKYSNGTVPDYLKPDVVAVGSSVASSYLGNSFVSLSGTSMSCPAVAGIIALMKQYNPSWTKEEIKLAVSENAERKVGGLDPLSYGGGFISAYRALNITSVVNASNKFLGKNTNNSNSYWNTSAIFEVVNMRNYSVNYSVFVNYTNDPYLNISINVSGVNLPKGNSTTIRLFLNITNINASNQRYFGFIGINSTPSSGYQAQNYTIPFSFVQSVNNPLCPVEYALINESITLPSNIYCYYDDWSEEGIIRFVSDDVYFDCNNSVIAGDATRGIGIYSRGYNNVTIKNCNVVGYWYGVYFFAAHNSSVYDNVINQSTYALGVFYSDNANMTRNEFNGGDRQIRVIHSDYFEIYNNSLYDAGSSSFDIESAATSGWVHNNYVENGDGEIWYVYSNNFTNNTFINSDMAIIWSRDNVFSDNNFTSTVNYSFLPLIEDSWDCSNTLSASNLINGKSYNNYCKVNNQVISGLDAGAVVLHTVNNVTLKDSNISHSIYVMGTCDGVVISNVSVTGFSDVYGYEGLQVDCSGGNINNVLFANSSVSRTGEGTYIDEYNNYDCSNITISKVVYNDTRVRAIRIYASSGIVEGVLFQDVNITNGGNFANRLKTSTLINTSFDNGGDYAGDNYSRQWWVSVRAFDNLSQQVLSANVTITDNESNVLASGWTGGNGSIGRVAVTEYMGNDGNKTIRYPHTIYVSKYGYNTNVTVINITGNQDLSLVMLPAEEQSKINNTGAYDLWGYLYIAVDKYEGGVWSTHAIIVNDSSPRNISVGNYLAIDQIYNGAGGWTADTNGTLRVLAEFRDDEGGALLNEDGSLMSVATVFGVGGAESGGLGLVGFVFGGGSLVLTDGGGLVLTDT